MVEHKWTPIQPLSENDYAINLGAIKPLYQAWYAAKERLQESSKASLEEFNRRLIRRLSVETGILERIYDLDSSTTETLVTKGFMEDFVSHSDTDIEPSRLIDILRDHQNAIQHIMDFIGNQRELTPMFIHELHQQLTLHQETVTSVDPSGTRLQTPLLKGEYKKLPNNPQRQDGTIHEYCPPVQVASEMDNLLTWLTDYSDDDPVIVSAWLHHRFTQIHPYQDGNGRVARSLANLILLKAELLPLIINRDMRSDYLEALEAADAGNLEKLAILFANQEKDAILQGLSVDSDAEVSQSNAITSAVIQSLAYKFTTRQKARTAELNRVNEMAEGIRKQALEIVANSLLQLKQAIPGLSTTQPIVHGGGPDLGNSHWYKHEVYDSAGPEKFVNFNEPHYFVKSSIRVETERLVFVVSLHHVGRELSGVMEATAFSRIESFENSDDREISFREFMPCNLDPFVFTYNTQLSDVTESFARWLDGALAVAIKNYGDRL